MTESTNPKGRALTAQIWVTVASGGWWKPRELAEALGVEGRVMHKNLQGMRRYDYLKKRTIPPEKRERVQKMGNLERVEYSVDNDSIIPPGLTTKQVLEALKGVPA